MPSRVGVAGYPELIREFLVVPLANYTGGVRGVLFVA